ncbi:MAG: S-adenosylmethionine:tRNA ribosyltransferase-isomerase [Solirubrobacteraceae bacterium]
MASGGQAGALSFELPARLEAREPPPQRDAVRLMVATRSDGRLAHTHFRDLPDFLAPGDLVVVNTSATLPAALQAGELTLHLSTPAPDGSPHWVVELRDGDRPHRFARAGDTLPLPAGGRAELLAPYASGRRLWLARLDLPAPLLDYLRDHGRPIRYGYVPRAWPLSAYQTVYANEPGSAEMPSAGRPFTAELITRLVAAGVQFAPVVLHTGVSSPERGEPPFPERYRVPDTTARLVNAAPGRVIAVGTTVVRALETVTAADGTVRDGAGWTRLVIGPERGLRAIDGLITGWHEPEASHLELLGEAAGDAVLHRAYREALRHGYRWHEFGDSLLVLP